MATCSRILAWEIPWTEEPGGQQSPRGLRESDAVNSLVHTHIQGFPKEEALKEAWLGSPHSLFTTDGARN